MIKLFLFLRIIGVFLTIQNPTDIIKKKHVLQLNLFNFETALKQHSYLFVLVYGSSCPHAQEMLKSYDKFTAHLHMIQSKFETALIHCNNRVEWQHHFNLIHNPTMLIYVKGQLIISQHWSKRLSRALRTIEYLMVKILENDEEMEQLVQKHPRAIIYIGDDQEHNNYFEFLELSYRKKHYEFLYIRVKNSIKYQNNNLYLYQGWNQMYKQIEDFPDLMKTINWLYHHSDHSILEFPKPALTQLIEHKNLGFVLLFEKSQDLQKKEYQDIYEQFELASLELYRSFKFTYCFLDNTQCKELITQNLKGKLDIQTPRVILIVPTNDFRSDFVGIRFNQQITKENLIQFSQNFFDQTDLQLEFVSEQFNQKEFDQGKLIGKNLFESVKNYPQNDIVVFYYRSGLKKDLKLLNQYQELSKYLKQNQDEDIKYHFYDIENNFLPKIFDNKNKELPALQTTCKSLERLKKSFGNLDVFK